MDQRTALNQTLEVFKLKAAHIAASSGVGENQISRYRKGKGDLYAETLKTIIDALPENARAYYYMLLLANGEKSNGIAESPGQYIVKRE